MRTHLATGIALTLCTALGVPYGCVAESGPDPEEGTTQEAQTAHPETPLGPGAGQYYTLRHETRPCNLDPCRGFLLQEVNRARPERRADRLDFTGSNLDEATVRTVTSAPATEVVLYGRFQGAKGDSAVFAVQAAFRGLPGLGAASDDAYFSVTLRNPPIACLVAPCDNDIATRLQTTDTQAFTTLSLDRMGAFRVDQRWLQERVVEGGAIVQGHLRDGADLPGGVERVLDAGQVYLRLPDRGGPCLLPFHTCRAPAVAEYTRDPNRCLIFQGCAERPECLPQRPSACADGYIPVRYRAQAPACWVELCDPAFLTE